MSKKLMEECDCWWVNLIVGWNELTDIPVVGKLRNDLEVVHIPILWVQISKYMTLLLPKFVLYLTTETPYLIR